MIGCQKCNLQRPSSQGGIRQAGRLPARGAETQSVPEINVDRTPWSAEVWTTLPITGGSLTKFARDWRGFSKANSSIFSRNNNLRGARDVDTPDSPQSGSWPSSKSWSKSSVASGPGSQQASGNSLRVPEALGNTLKRAVSTGAAKPGTVLLGSLAGGPGLKVGEKPGRWPKQKHAPGSTDFGLAWEAQPPAVRSATSRQAMLEAVVRRKMDKSADSDVMLKKANAAKALALDREWIGNQQVQSKEKDREVEAQRKRDQERQLQRLFAPIPSPHNFLPERWKGCDITAKHIIKHKCSKPENWASVDMNAKHQAALANLCASFAMLLKPYVEKEGADERDAPLLTRPAFCRMLIDLNLSDTNGELIYHVALDLFDNLATQVSLKGCPMTSGLISGIVIDEYDDKILVLFTSLLSWIFEDNQGLLTLEDIRACFFDGLVSAAAKKCRRRNRHIVRQIAQGKDIFRVPLAVPVKPVEEQPKKTGGLESQVNGQEEKNDAEVKTEDAADAGVLATVENVAAKFLGRRLSQASRRGSITANAVGGRRASVVKRGSVLTRRKSKEASGSQGASNGAERRTPDHDKDETESVASSALEGKEEQQDPAATLYAHTCMVSKGEFLSNMLLEPEVVHLVFMFYESFTTIFEIYSDVTTEFLGMSRLSGGHMSHEGFLRFCIDFKLFPNLIDFNSLSCFYESAENVQEITRNDVKKRTYKDPNRQQFLPGNIVQLTTKLTLERPRQSMVEKAMVETIKAGEALKVVAIDSSDVDAEAALVMTSRGRKVWVRTDDLVLADKAFAGQKMPVKTLSRLDTMKATWINKSFEEMSPVEQKSLVILASFSDFMASRKLRSKDFFSKFDEAGRGDINVNELMKGVTFMCLGGSLRTSKTTPPPAFEEVQNLFNLIDMDGGGSLDYHELDVVLKNVQERKSRMSKQDNLFMKDREELSAGEQAAVDFFVPMYHSLEARGWTALDFLSRYDSDGDGELSARELLEAGRDLEIVTSEIPNFDRALMCVDLNFDGGLSSEEITRILNFVKEALRGKNKIELEIPNPFLAEAANKKEPLVGVFGIKAFIECVLKIGLSFLCFHGSPEQSLLPVEAKVVWLVTYLQWQISEGEHCEDLPISRNQEFLDQKLTTALQKFGSRRTSLGNILKEFSEKGYKPMESIWDDDGPGDTEGPMAKLKEDHLDLFRECPTGSPILFCEDQSRQEACSACGVEPMNGWGSASCSQCSHGEVLVRACFTHPPDSVPVLNKLVSLLGTKKMSRSMQHSQTLSSSMCGMSMLDRALSAWQSK
eukprot:TRINITY_DN2692_c0_g1_i2.p1 TRINITY_DN2692_c0_g1~~TRINITY_DN2692_c0_g1_i2.p1  ORF type:complete len:1287 (+),score=310.23 TRINITY_DN2692_c0_g1_i2:39-3899(+)